MVRQFSFVLAELSIKTPYNPRADNVISTNPSPFAVTNNVLIICRHCSLKANITMVIKLDRTLLLFSACKGVVI